MFAQTTCRFRSVLHPQRLRRCLSLWVLLVLSVDSGAELLDEPLKPLPPIPALAPGRVELGRQLFNDPRLSHNGTLSCASCHRLDTYGVDGRAFSMGADGLPLALNTPSWSLPDKLGTESMGHSIPTAGSFQAMQRSHCGE